MNVISTQAGGAKKGSLPPFTWDDALLLDDGKIETYRFAPAGKPTLDTPFGKVATARYNRRNPRTGRALSLWFAPQYHGVPVRVEQIETGKPTVSLVLGEIKFDTAKSEK